MEATSLFALLLALAGQPSAEPEHGQRLPPADFVTTTPSVSAADSARAEGKLTPRPPKAELKAIWEGGTWSQDIGRAGTFLSGYKDASYFAMPEFEPPNRVPLNAEARAVEMNIRREMAKGRQIFGPYAMCHPSGMPYILTMSGYGGYQAVISDNEIDFFAGNQREVRRIFTDGRKHPDERTTAPLYNGVSVAHWEGKTMVVETTNIRADNTQIEPYIPKHEGMYVVERYTPVSKGRIDLHVTVTSPEFTRPWIVKLKLTNDPDSKLIEAKCSDDNRWVYGKDGELVLTGPDGLPLEKAEEP